MASSKRTYDMAVYPVEVAVRSEHDGALTYNCHLPYCPCADFANRKGVLVPIEGGFAVTLCKHLLNAMERVAGWHRKAQPDVYAGLPLQAATELLMGLGMTRTVSRMILTDAADTAVSEFFKDVAGATASGKVEGDKLRGRYTVTVY